MENKKHQHKIWIQYHLESDHAVISYGYPDSYPHRLPEQRIDIKLSKLNEDLRRNLCVLHEKVASKIPEPESVRLPHAIIKPEITYGYFTLAALDQDRANELPLCRLYYHEDVKVIPSRVEKFIRITKPEMDEELLSIAKKTSKQLRKLVWEHYKKRFEKYFID